MAESQEAEVKETSAIGKGEGDKSKCRIIVQGGAYSSRICEHHLSEEYERVTKTAAQTGYNVMMEGKTAVDAVEAAVSVFEGSEYFNAGVGSALNNFGEVECDAMIMDGKRINTGAVMALSRFLHPVRLARKVMDDGRHCALSGDGALEFAREIGYNSFICNPKKLKGQNPNQTLNIDIENYETFASHRYNGEPVQESQFGETDGNEPLQESQSYDTVSAVAMDAQEHLACATSSGGMAGKRKGRVGDVPLVGCGGYANEVGTATTTGNGEAIMKLTLARKVVYSMEQGTNAKESSQKALNEMFSNKIIKCKGGVIAIDKDGNFGIAFNTEVMVWASIKDGDLKFGMYPENETDQHPDE